MKKEIVIASYEEDTSWLPDSWAPKTLIYSCGNPIKKMEDRFVSEEYLAESQKKTNYPNRYDSTDPYLETMKLLELIKKMRHVLWDYEGIKHLKENEEESFFVHKKNENNKNSLESNQWLTHIIQRYDVLADVTIFLQGHPHDHYKNWIEVGSVEFDDDFSFCALPNHAKESLPMNSDYDKAAVDLWGKIYNYESWDNEVCWAAGAQFAVSKKVIQSRPKTWYMKIKSIAEHHEYSAHALERTWWEVFGRPEITNFK